MKNKKQFKNMKTLFISLISLILVLNVFNFIFAQQNTPWPAFNSCCERTKSGAWCQNAPESECDTSYRNTPTSCDATSYCKLGCCVDSEEGLCMENSPQKVCEISTGTWLSDSKCEVPQCELGCCIIGDQASFVTLTRCKRLSNLYGLEINYKKDISNEPECIMTAYSQEKGACVFKSDDGTTCRMTTRGECQSAKVGNGTQGGEFWKDYLCSADEIGADCGPTKETICVQGKNEVYFKDSCGNPANIYDANKIYSKEPSYWQKIVPKEESCGFGSQNGNAGSKTCGNCNYLSGSICKKGSTTYGNFICKDVNCYDTKNGNSYKNGESWCVYQSTIGEGQDAVGSRHYRHICVNGEEIVEPCADFRNEVCHEDKFGTSQGSFNEAACRANRWVDCIDQLEQEDCENTDKRDCYWVKGAHYDGSASQTQKSQNVAGTSGGASKNTGSSTTASPVTGSNLADEDPNKENFGILQGGGICLPNYPPGLEFWQESNAKAICSLGNSKQTVKFEANILGNKKCKENCEVRTGKWVNQMNDICTSLGDCGNFVNLAGVYTDEGVVVKDNGIRRKISEGVADAAEPKKGGGAFEGLFG